MELSREEGMNILRSWGSGKNKLRFLARERLAHVNVGATIKEVSDDIDLDTAHDYFFHLSVKDATFARDDPIDRPPAYLMQDALFGQSTSKDKPTITAPSHAAALVRAMVKR
jgi:hypothetical protein